MVAILKIEDMANYKLIEAYKDDPEYFYRVMKSIPDILDTVNMLKDKLIEFPTAQALYSNFKYNYNIHVCNDRIRASDNEEYVLSKKGDADLNTYFTLLLEHDLFKIPSWLIVDDIIKIMEPEDYPIQKLKFPLWNTHTHLLWYYTTDYGRYKWGEYGRTDIEEFFLSPNSECATSYGKRREKMLPNIEACDTERILNIKKQFNSILFSIKIPFNGETGYL